MVIYQTTSPTYPYQAPPNYSLGSRYTISSVGQMFLQGDRTTDWPTPIATQTRKDYGFHNPS